MKALVLEEYKKFVYKDVPTPVPGEGEVLVRVEGLCGVRQRCAWHGWLHRPPPPAHHHGA